MAKRRPNPRLVKIHYSYTVGEIADLFAIHKHTIRQWVKAGLPVLNDRRPMLIHGPELVAFLQARRSKNKRKCLPWEMYCLRCREAKHPAGSMADYLPETDQMGMLKGLCPDCECMMNRRTSIAKLELIRGNLDITFPQGWGQVSNTTQPNVNIDFK